MTTSHSQLRATAETIGGVVLSAGFMLVVAVLLAAVPACPK
jgi:hypothetical protein